MCGAWQAPSCICLTFGKGSLGMLPPVTLCLLRHQHQVNLGNFILQGIGPLFLWPWSPPLCRRCIAALDISWMLRRSSQSICKCRVLTLVFLVRKGAGNGTQQFKEASQGKEFLSSKACLLLGTTLGYVQGEPNSLHVIAQVPPQLCWTTWHCW